MDVAELKPVALDLHWSLRTLDSSRFSKSSLPAVRDRIAAVKAKLDKVAPAFKDSNQVGAAVTELRTLLHNYLANRYLNHANEKNDADSMLSEGALADNVLSDEAREKWIELRNKLHQAYDRLVIALRSHSVSVPDFRPTNHARTFFHMGIAALAITVILLFTLYPSLEFGYLKWITVAIAVGVWTTQLAVMNSRRVHRVCLSRIGQFAHKHEYHRVNSATWFGTSLVVLSLLGPIPAVLGIAALGFGDAAAGFLVGGTGKPRSVKHVHSKVALRLSWLLLWWVIA